MANDIDQFAVRATPELMAELDARRYGDTQALTDYAVGHHIHLPDGYNPGWLINLVFDDEGNELGLYWRDANDNPQAI